VRQSIPFSGRFTHSDGAPIAGSEIRLQWWRDGDPSVHTSGTYATTGSDGGWTFSWSFPYADTYHIWAYAEDENVPSDPMDLKVVEMPPNSVILNGKVVTYQIGEENPVPGALVKITTDSKQVFSGYSLSDGTFTTPLSVGTYKAEVTCAGYEPYTTTLYIEEDMVGKSYVAKFPLTPTDYQWNVRVDPNISWSIPVTVDGKTYDVKGYQYVPWNAVDGSTISAPSQTVDPSKGTIYYFRYFWPLVRKEGDVKWFGSHITENPAKIKFPEQYRKPGYEWAVDIDYGTTAPAGTTVMPSAALRSRLIKRVRLAR
jgi:hypothetical protein